MANNIFKEILVFSKELSLWQHEAIRRMFIRGILSQKDKDELWIIAQKENGIIEGLPDQVLLTLTEKDLPTPPSPGRSISLVGLRDLINVNALKGSRLPIGKQLTVVYGYNGSGKSGYARVMKKAFRARAVEAILPNVYAVSDGKPASAIFEIEENATVRDEIWIDGQAIPSALGRFAVFDSKCGRVYIANSNELGFLPYGFDIITGLGSITKEIKDKFQDLAGRHTPKKDDLNDLVDSTSCGRFVKELSDSTAEDDIARIAKWSEEDGELLLLKEKELLEIRANSPQAIRVVLNEQKKNLERIKNVISNHYEAVSEFRLIQIKQKVSDLQKYQEALKVAAAEAFGGMELNDIGGEVWREMLLAAEKYSRQIAYPGQAFPAKAADAKCVLCLQPLGDDARAHLQGFWQFIENDISSKCKDSLKEVEVELKALERMPQVIPQEVEVLEDSLGRIDKNIFEFVKEFYVDISKRVKAFQHGIKTSIWDAIPPEPKSLRPLIEENVFAISERLKGVSDDVKVVERIRCLEGEIAECKSRQKLFQNIQRIYGYLKNLKFANSAKSASEKISTYGISLKARELQNLFVTEEFKKRVLGNLNSIGVDRIRTGVEPHSEKGRVLHKITIDGAASSTPEAVFSEGEMTAIALSCFLSELAASDDNCGIVLDDPVTSLDHKIRKGVVSVLVKESISRQIIIFTHDLVFLRDLWEEAIVQKVTIDPLNVEARGGISGILTTRLPWSGTKVSARISHLDKLLKDAEIAEKTSHPEEFHITQREFYDLLRSTWERAVEEVLFNGVVERLEHGIKTLSLDGVHVDTESIEAVFKGMTRTSAVIESHDHASAENPVQPSLDDMKNDLESFKVFLAKQKSKNADAKVRHTHLKPKLR